MNAPQPQQKIGPMRLSEILSRTKDPSLRRIMDEMVDRVTKKIQEIKKPKQLTFWPE